ncbi:MAG: hypothetical protein ACRETZ_06905 [Steroidobacteraceae bacterium]
MALAKIEGFDVTPLTPSSTTRLVRPSLAIISRVRSSIQQL